MSPPLRGKRNSILFTLLGCPCQGLLTFHQMPTNTCRNPCSSSASAPGPMPPWKPTGKEYCSTLGGDRRAWGSSASVTRFCVLSTSCQPGAFRRLNGLSETMVKACGSFGHGPLPGGTTEITADAVWPWDAAVMVAVPAVRPVTTPFESTAPTAGASLAQVMRAEERGWPAESNAVAKSCHEPCRGRVAVSG